MPRPVVARAFAFAALALAVIAPPAFAKPGPAPVAGTSKLRQATIQRLRTANPQAEVEVVRRSAAQIERARPPLDLSQLAVPSPAQAASRSALAADLEVDPSSLTTPREIGFGRPAFSLPSGIEVLVQALGSSSVHHHDGSLIANWLFDAVPSSWPGYDDPYGVAIHLTDVPANRQVVLDCELTVYNGNTLRLIEMPGDPSVGEALTMTVPTVASDEAWGATTAFVKYVTAPRPRKGDAHVYIAADQFSFRDGNCSIAELTP